MSTLEIVLIDCANGDSIYLEHVDREGEVYRGLIDANDYREMRSTYTYLKRRFQRTNVKLPDQKPVFNFVLLSHPHLDHAQGLKMLLQSFGTLWFSYPKSTNWSGQSALIDYANRSSNVVEHEHMDGSKSDDFADFGDVDIEVLWPPVDVIDSHEENNNSVILKLTFDGLSVVLGGDAEEDVWNNISGRIDDNTRFFKVPHHGSVNGTFGDHNHNTTPWLDRCPPNVHLGISCHISPHKHPDQEVINCFRQRNFQYYRTDENHHLTYSHKKDDLPEMKYSRF